MIKRAHFYLSHTRNAFYTFVPIWATCEHFGHVSFVHTHPVAWDASHTFNIVKVKPRNVYRYFEVLPVVKAFTVPISKV